MWINSRNLYTTYRPYEMKHEIWSEEAESHAYEAGQVIKIPNYENPK